MRAKSLRRIRWRQTHEPRAVSAPAAGSAAMNRGDLAPMKPQVYVDPRPAGYFDRFHQRARAREPDWVYTLIRILTYPYCRVAFRLHAEIETLPSGAPTILAPTHFSGMDHWFVGMLLTRRVRFMAKSQLFRGPVLDFVCPCRRVPGSPGPARRGGDRHRVVGESPSRQPARDVHPEGGRSRSADQSHSEAASAAWRSESGARWSRLRSTAPGRPCGSSCNSPP